MTDMRTNFQMVCEFSDYMPAESGITSRSEIMKITEHFELDKMNKLELQNLRDFVVLYYRGETMRDKFEAMLSITAVIDIYLYRN